MWSHATRVNLLLGIMSPPALRPGTSQISLVALLYLCWGDLDRDLNNLPASLGWLGDEHIILYLCHEEGGRYVVLIPQEGHKSRLLGPEMIAHIPGSTEQPRCPLGDAGEQGTTRCEKPARSQSDLPRAGLQTRVPTPTRNAEAEGQFPSASRPPLKPVVPAPDETRVQIKRISVGQRGVREMAFYHQRALCAGQNTY